MKLRFYLYSLIFFLLTTVACMAPKNEPPVYSQELARAGDIVIKEDVLRFRLRLEMDKFPKDYFKEVAQNPERKKEMQSLVNEVLAKIITNYTIIAYGQKKGIKLSAKEVSKRIEMRKKKWNPKSFDAFLNEKNIAYVRWRQMVENEIRVQYVMDQELSKETEVTLAEIRNYYARERHEFEVPERVRARHIVTDSLDKANDLHERLQKGENFAKVAVHHSLAPDRAVGGDLGYFAEGSYPKVFDEACFNLQKGEISPVVKSDYGYHIFKLLGRKPAGRKTLEEATPQISQKLFEEKLKKKYDVWINKVRSEIDVTIYRDVLKNFMI